MTTPPPGAPGGPPGKKKGILADPAKRKAAIAVAVVAAVAGVAYIRSRGSSSSDSGSGGDSGTASGSQPADFTGDDSGGDFDDLDSQVQNLQGQLATLSAEDARLAGAAGKPPNLWDIAKEALAGRGNTRPTSAQIYAERRKLFGVGQAPRKAPAPRKLKPRPVRKKSKK